ncbi:DNA photolyase, FAD-binding/Cryptochrome [Chaetomium sp. MPI-SDFR-AT-0129]|nr:DNA photolyase, FAD-binding/Cryptochrome [Chaetomium sp. MPI-SDFR-AT-0129]
MSIINIKRATQSTSPTRQVPSAAASLTSGPGLDPLRQPHPFHEEAERHGIVLRKFYPPEMSNARARTYQAGEIPRPIEQLNAALQDTLRERESLQVKDAVVHWFKTDLRTADNHALSCASQKARETGVPLIAMYLISPQDFEAHLVSPVRVDFVLRSLRILRDDLAKLDIPLYVETVEERRQIPARIAELMGSWGATHLYANMEYEVDELRREAKLARMLAEKGMCVETMHDTCVVPPGRLQTGAGKQYAVYTPWFRSWMAHLREEPGLLELCESPVRNPKSARRTFGHVFDSEIPVTVRNKTLADEDAIRLRALWPAGEHEAKKRLDAFCKQRIGHYDRKRNFPAEAATSSLSVHLASGTLSARTAVRTARDRSAGGEGTQTWISEVAWRDFYKHVLVNWPYICMNKPFKPEYSNINWSYDEAHFAAWCEGRTGYPIVDAAMRQLREMGWMHNRCRMIVASFLSKDLLIDWRMGERFFMEHLIDGDFASNNGGWGFSASVGVDPQPYFRIFNPRLQSEKFDKDGDYIRKWVPELRGIESSAIHEPYARGAGALARKNGYPEPIVDHSVARERALAAYKEGIESVL